MAPRHRQELRPGTDPNRAVERLYRHGRTFPDGPPHPQHPPRSESVEFEPHGWVATHRANGDTELAGTTVQQIADIDAGLRNLGALYDQYVRSQQPPPQEQLTTEERRARPWDKMSWQDGLELARESKYGKDLSFADPHVQAGYYEAIRRRQRGE